MVSYNLFICNSYLFLIILFFFNRLVTDLSIQTLTSLATTDLLNIGMDRLITVTISTIEIGKAIVVTDIMVYFCLF